ncbi:MAG TPA: hypothetical protein VFB13_12585 [Reyranella sp.]|jgi:hypothetical protein|nr:hypothetical protein [Reyranella sp.]
MKMKAFLALSLLSFGLAACEKQQDDVHNLPGPNGLLPDGSPPRAEAPKAPDPGTYTGSPRGNSRPPMSGLNADPRNPNGAPGTIQ